MYCYLIVSYIYIFTLLTSRTYTIQKNWHLPSTSLFVRTVCWYTDHCLTFHTVLVNQVLERYVISCCNCCVPVVEVCTSWRNAGLIWSEGRKGSARIFLMKICVDCFWSYAVLSPSLATFLNTAWLQWKTQPLMSAVGKWCLIAPHAPVKINKSLLLLHSLKNARYTNVIKID